MNFGVGKELDAMVGDIERAEAEGDHPGAEAVALALVKRLIQMSDDPVDEVEGYVAGKRTIGSVFGTEARAERAEQEGG